MRAQAFLEFAAFALCLLVALAIVTHCTGCAPAKAASDELSKVADEEYKADQKWCVDRFFSPAEVMSCREGLRTRKWGIATTTPDGGPR